MTIAQIVRRSLAGDAGGGGTTLFAMDMSSGAAEAAGWGTAIPEAGLPHTRERQATGSLAGGPGYLITQTPGSAGDNYYGWSDRTYLQAHPIAAGHERYLRLKIHFPSGQDFGGTTMVNKILTPHDSTDDVQERAIMQIEVSASSLTFKVQHDAGVNMISHAISTQTNTRYAIQWYMRYSSGLNVADGEWKLWVNNNTFASPNASRSSMIQNVPTGSSLDLMRSGYMNTALGGGNTHSIFYEAFEVGTAFNSSWAT